MAIRASLSQVPVRGCTVDKVKKSILLALASAAAVVIMIGIQARQQLVVPEPDRVSTTTQPSADAPATTNTDGSALPQAPIATPDQAENKRGKYHTLNRPAKHDHDHSHQVKLPVEIRAYIEKQRIPQQQLQPTQHSDGRLSLDPKGQFETVSIAVIGDDGELTITERQIQPIQARK